MGDTASLRFQGKLIAATNRDSLRTFETGRFREDLYYRLCSDQISTPSLAQQLADSPRVLGESITYMARKIAGAESEELAAESDADGWSRISGREYAWPGNYRELEQCVRNVLIRRDYRPARSERGDAADELARELAGRPTYCRSGTLAATALYVYRQTGSYEETARRLQLDRRTVKARSSK